MSNKFYILIKCNNEATVKLSSYDTILDEHDEWAIVNLYGSFDYNKLFYNEFINEIALKHSSSYLIIKNPKGVVSIKEPLDPSLSSKLGLEDFNMNLIFQKFEEIEKFNK